MLISLIIPMYNEEKNAERSLLYAESFLTKNGYDYRIFAVNDGSKDKTAEVLSQYAKTHERVSIVSYSQNRGKGYAVRRGILSASGDIAVVTDCDLAYGLEPISVITDLLSEYDLAIGSRRKAGGGYRAYSLKRKIFSGGFHMVVKMSTGLRVSDTQCGIKGFRMPAAKKIFSLCECNGFAYDIEVLSFAEKLGMKIAEFGARIKNHKDSESKVNIFRDPLKMLGEIKNIKKNTAEKLKEIK